MIARTNAHADSNKSNYQHSSPTAGLQKHSESPTFQQIQLVSNHWHPNNPLASLGAQCTRGFQQIQLPTRRSNCVLAKIQGKSNIPANPTSEQPLDPQLIIHYQLQALEPLAHRNSSKSNYQLSIPTVGLQKHRESPTFQLIQLVSNHWDKQP